MRKKLLVTAAMSALIGCTTLAVAQTPAPEGQPGKSVAPSPGAPQHPGGQGGAMAHPQPGGQATPGGAAQNPQSVPQQKQSQGRDQGQDHPNQGLSQSEDRNNPTTQRGAQSQDQHGAQNNEPGKTNQQPGQRGDNAAQGNPANAPQGNAAQNKASGGANVQLSQDQRSKIHGIIGGGRDVARVDSVNFNITVGTAVPRTVHIAALPVEIVEIVPEYRGFEYIVVGDQLLIIDPNSLAIVAILPA